MLLKSEFFFNLLQYDHRTLFPKDRPVWAALSDLPFYLGSMLAQKDDPYRSGSDLRARYPDARFEAPHEVRIASTARLGPFIHIEGRVLIEDDVRIETGAHLVGPLIVGRGAVIGQGTQVKRSILFPGAKAPHKNTVLDSILGHQVNLGGHLVTPNKRIDGRTVPIRMSHGQRVDTGRPKLGLIAGDGCSFGCAVRFSPGDYYLPNTRLA